MVTPINGLDSIPQNGTRCRVCESEPPGEFSPKHASPKGEHASWIESLPPESVLRVSPLIDICPLDELPPGGKRLVVHEDLEIGVINCRGEIFAIEDRCSHDDGELVDGELDEEDCAIECPRHGSRFDLRTGKPMNLPAYVPVDTFPVVVEDGVIRVEVD